MFDSATTQVLDPVPPAPAAGKRGGRRSRWLLISGLLIVLLAGVTLFAIAPLRNPLPVAAVARTLPGSATIPGKAPVVPWPATGQAALSVEGVGSLGTSGGSEPVPIASVTKVMTAYLILTEHPLKRGEHGPKLTVSAAQAAAYPGELARGESLVPVVAGAVFTQRQALQAVLLPSANNMARILAAWDAGSIDAFVAKMNATAEKLGMKDTRYTDPSGLDPGTVSTAVDQVILARKAMRLPAFAEIAAQKKATLPVAGEVKNYNSLVGRDGVVGIKTGSTDEAGGCLVFAAVVKVGGRKVTIVGAVLGQPGANTPVQLDRVFKATRPLVRTATAALTAHPVVRTGDQVATVTGPLGTGTTIHAGKDLTVVGWPGMRVRLDVEIPAIPARLPAQTEHGQLTAVTDGGGAPVTAALHSGERLEPPSNWERIRQHR
ncbi:D-alanyl-D-alanine carboxypeptidase family protein [Plantactinospora mayteni]|uniref:D-alanyl-D-alanine carboxypeptidase family protein n=1 Tax=Plantactinospora mayteni TaxID=566021 RepID=UPI001943FBB4|nr:D-alanyl-D-alanine carboxypeptidase [Plantactinospora mayteni]